MSTMERVMIYYVALGFCTLAVIVYIGVFKLEVAHAYIWSRPCRPCSPAPRLMLYSLMNLCPLGLALWAPVCASWGVPARGTTMRSLLNPHGQCQYQFVSDGNKFVSRRLDSISLSWDFNIFQHHTSMIDSTMSCGFLRMVLGILLILSQHCYYLVEQPSQSLLYLHKRWQWLSNRVAFVSCQICMLWNLILVSSITNLYIMIDSDKIFLHPSHS